MATGLGPNVNSYRKSVPSGARQSFRGSWPTGDGQNALVQDLLDHAPFGEPLRFYGRMQTGSGRSVRERSHQYQW